MIKPNFARPNFRALTVESQGAMPPQSFSAAIKLTSAQFQATSYSAKVPREQMPAFELGSLVVITSNGASTHAGMVTEEFNEGKLPKFGFHAWPLSEVVTLRSISAGDVERIGGFAFREFAYQFEGVANGQVVTGRVKTLRQATADHLRAQIATVVPPRILEVFWTQFERDAILAAEVEQNRYSEAASALLADLSH